MKIFQPKPKSVYQPKIRGRPKRKKKWSSLKFSPVFGPNLGVDQKKGLHSNLVQLLAQKKVFAHRFCVQTFCPPCHNFA